MLGNLIGTDVTGAYPLGNVGDGVRIVDGASGNTVGGTITEAANVISHNGINGVYLAGSGTSDNVVLGNFIGTDIVRAHMASAISRNGISIENGATNNGDWWLRPGFR